MEERGRDEIGVEKNGGEGRRRKEEREGGEGME